MNAQLGDIYRQNLEPENESAALYTLRIVSLFLMVHAPAGCAPHPRGDYFWSFLIITDYLYLLLLIITDYFLLLLTITDYFLVITDYYCLPLAGCALWLAGCASEARGVSAAPRGAPPILGVIILIISDYYWLFICIITDY